MARVPDESVWGKSQGLDRPYPLVRHLLDAAAMTLHLWGAYLSDGQRRHIAEGLGLSEDPLRARALVALCAGVHDVGKLTNFQFCDERGRERLSSGLVADAGAAGVQRTRHDVAGMQVAPVLLAALGFEEDSDRGSSAVERVAEIIGGHHGVFAALERDVTDTAAYQERFGGAVWGEQRVAHAACVFHVLGRPRPPQGFTASAGVLVTGVVILADWLVSQEQYLTGRQQQLDVCLDEHFAVSVRDAPRLAEDAGLTTRTLSRKAFRDAYDIAGEPNALQSSLVAGLERALASPEAGKTGIVVVTAAPGDGKSEAALEAERVLSRACGTRGFSFLLPTMATSDQMYERVAGSLARQGGQGAGLTLTHSMAWLSVAYSADGSGSEVLVCSDDLPSVEAGEHVRAMRPVQWLRGAKRALLAQWSVGTIDQALLAVLPVRHNALRLLALSGKTVIVDEAHAYDPYMQVLLGRLLNWLGAFGVPVILLSATLPVSISDQLVREYLRGAGHGATSLKRRSFPVPYPGWLYVDAASAHCTAISEPEREKQAAERRTALAVTVEPVTHRSPTEGPAGRLAVIERILQSLVSGKDGGCALVVCNTVDEAQDTYSWLRERFAGRGLAPNTVELLHARLPGDVREERTQRITRELGRSGDPARDADPVRKIIVATQVVEQSLDLDADVVISDLAPLSLLLQRAGRCWRHEAWWSRHGRPRGARPRWAAGPHLIVLDPLGGGGPVPVQWGTIYPEYLLLDTSKVLVKRNGAPVTVPDDVQELVERVHGDPAGLLDWENPRWEQAWGAYKGEEMAERSVGGAIAVPRRRSVRRLHQMHGRGVVDEGRAATRLGADSVRLLCVYEQEDGRIMLDLLGKVKLPEPGKDRRIPVDGVRAVMRRTIPARADWFPLGRDDLGVPPGWEDHPLLGELVVLRQSVVDGRVRPVDVNGKSLHLGDELGLVRR